MDSADFERLMGQLRSGSQDAAWELTTAYAPYIYRSVRRMLDRRMRSKFDSQDAVQSVWKSFFRYPDRLANITSPEQLIAILGAMARNKMIDQYRGLSLTQKRDVAREVYAAESSGSTAHEITSPICS